MTPSVSPIRSADRRRLDSWKGIAQYLGRDVTTVRRWEKREALPVHRHLHAKLGSVYAFTDEIDEWWRRRSTSLGLDVAPAIHRPRLWLWAPVGVGLGLLLLVTATAIGGRGATVSGPIVERRIALAPPAGVVIHSLVVSPDGARIAFAGRGGTGGDLWVKQLDSLVADRLPGTDNASFPFWSPDGAHVGFFADGRLKTITLATREIRDLAAAPDGYGGTWNSRGDIVFAPDHDAGLFRTSFTLGGLATVTTVLPGPRSGHAWPEFLPDDRHVLYTDNRYGEHGIHVLDLETGQSKRLIAAFTRASYTAPGFLLFVKGQLFAQAFDLATLELRGDPVPIADRVLQWGDLAYHADFSVSRDGLIIVRSAEDERNKLVWIDRRSGQVVGQIGEVGYSGNPTLSPDGRTLAVTVHDFQSNHSRIWLFDTATGEGRPWTDGKMAYSPLWSASGDRLFFLTGWGDATVQERLLAADGDRATHTLPGMYVLDSATRDARLMTYGRLGPGTKWDVWGWRHGESNATFPILTSPANEGTSRLSPDGRFLAYASDESGRFEVYVRPLADGGVPWKVSTAGGADPDWSADGRELFYIADDRQMMATTVTATANGVRTGTPKALFGTGLEMLWKDTRNHYDLTPDGRRFILLTPATDRRLAPFTMIVNWRR
jgi:Tol biopolymer transport system component